ncbi:MAG: TAXI family TRAP transporter solute-binding subunit [Deltaproteobacteria bacterium]|jgi:uncharacterized protein|nr:TAXI family TRAP transporter solute-binding subunit [Deltaproteobacteria bacterium]MBT4267658.1 TAXI family TRAP transporter solute-binding subunit [Deltaproteobacteria bacterium]MBT4644838.1 TAXI family TRAP transporter solute-binding subunit [Deltaproteobacteria bacterium]MBT6610946.1 TAXI family TRAP transporter solute-binding subunit [Deltaproteobacteria bacterium]MBT7155251.1 TAXI family TRAP transporter solute-binding subunit [Deltaproteobacteria bacterium]
MVGNWNIRKRLFVALIGIVITTSIGWNGFIPKAQAFDIVIGANQLTSIEFHAGRLVCRLINSNSDNMHCQPRVTSGFSYNMDNVRLGALDLGIVRSDVHFRAIRKQGIYKFKNVTYENIRSLFSLHTAPFTLIASQKSKIRALDDLLKKRINIGPRGTVQHSVFNQIFLQKGWSKGDFIMLEELPGSQSQDTIAFCHGRIQAIVYAMVHPNPTAKKLIQRCNGTLIPIDQPTIKQLVSTHPYFSSTRIPQGLYKTNKHPTTTFGLKSTIVASEDLDHETVYHIVKTVFTNIRYFKKAHPVFGDLNPKIMVREGLTAPLHSGAIQFYKENGLL